MEMGKERKGTRQMLRTREKTREKENGKRNGGLCEYNIFLIIAAVFHQLIAIYNACLVSMDIKVITIIYFSTTNSSPSHSHTLYYPDKSVLFSETCV